MTLINAFGDIALDTSVQEVTNAVEAASEEIQSQLQALVNAEYDETQKCQCESLQRNARENIIEKSVYVRNIDDVFGSQRIVNNNRVQVETSSQPQVIFTNLNLNIANKDITIPINNYNSLSLQLHGTWAGTITFEASLDGQNWLSIYGSSMAGASILTTTANVIARFSVAGIQYFRARYSTYTSGTAKVIAVLSGQPVAVNNPIVTGTVSATASGSGSTLQQRATPGFELITYDSNNALMKDALQKTDFWNPRGVYYVGDTVLYNNQVYQCIAGTRVNYYLPTNTTYWQVDQRQNKSLITTDYVSKPDAPRIRIELDMDGYQYRLAEMQMLIAQQSFVYDLVEDSAKISLMQSGFNSGFGNNYALGQDGMSHYKFEEVR